MNNIFFLYLGNADCYTFFNIHHKDILLKDRWHRHKSKNNYYVRNSKKVYLHSIISRIIHPPIPGRIACPDHLDNNGLNNLDDNLKRRPYSENIRRAKNKNPLHNIKKRVNPSGDIVYRVNLRLNGQFIEIGRFRILEDAIEARDNFFVSNKLITR